jgi:metal-responsive CopG/Arc/MetJ family transcriptional regulator
MSLKGNPRDRVPLHTPLALQFPVPMIEEIDNIVASRSQFDRPARSNVIRQLLAEALAARRNAGNERHTPERR